MHHRPIPSTSTGAVLNVRRNHRPRDEMAWCSPSNVAAHATPICLSKSTNIPINPAGNAARFEPNAPRLPKRQHERGESVCRHDLLGFPGAEAEHPKVYHRRLWLPAENDRTSYPKFHGTDVIEMVKLAIQVINSLANNAVKLYKQHQGSAFLKAKTN
ncbi:hypothetical protein EJ07DRAFT_151628 [Lizonia empirigonia]|nr:hypothetical protein EJ07DRAFT_151628 [Lizonia empirigonia]